MTPGRPPALGAGAASAAVPGLVLVTPATPSDSTSPTFVTAAQMANAK